MPAKSKDEVLQEYINHIKYLVTYWSTETRKTDKEKCEGLAFSILVMLDGCAGLPPVTLVLDCAPESEQETDDGEKYYERGMALNNDFMLHDLFFVKERQSQND